MLLLIECIAVCIIFTILILPDQYHKPLSRFASYTTAIKKTIQWCEHISEQRPLEELYQNE